MNVKPSLSTLFSLLLLAVLVLTSCVRPSPLQGNKGLTPQHPTADQVTVFFSKNRGSQIVTEGVVRDIPQQPTQEPLEFALTELLQGPNTVESTQGFFSEIPKGTRLIGMSHQNNTIQINLSGQFTSGGGSNSMQQRLAELSKTILAAEKEKPVYVSIEGQELKVLGGEGVMVNEPINKGQEAIQ